MINTDFNAGSTYFEACFKGIFLDRIVSCVTSNPIPLILAIMAIARIIFTSYNHSVTHKSNTPTLNCDILTKIFEEFDLKNLYRISSVCKTWQTLTHDGLLIKKIIYHNHAVNPHHWNHFFGKGTIADSGMSKAFDTLSSKTFEVLKSSSLAFANKLIMDTHILIWIPETINGKELTVNNFMDLVKMKMNQGSYYIWPQVKNLIGDKPITSRFVLISKFIIPGSLNKSYDEQKDLVSILNKRGNIFWKIPLIGESVICTYLYYFKTGKSIFNENPELYSRCEEEMRDLHLITGAFDPLGLYIGCSKNARCDVIGIIPISYL